MLNIVVHNFRLIRLLLRDAWITALIISFIALAIHQIFEIKALILVLGIVLGYILAYSLNDYYDADEDRFSSYKSEHNFFVNHSFPPLIAAILIGSIVSTMFVIFSSFGFKGVGIFLVSLTTLWAYSSKPLRLRNIPLVDVIVHSTFIVSYPYFIILVLLEIQWTLIDYLLLSIFVIGSAIIQLENQIRDFDIDIQHGTNTTITLGIENTGNLIRFLTIVMTVIVIYGFIQLDEVLLFLPFALIYSPLVYQRLSKTNNIIRSEKQIRLVIGMILIYSTFLLAYFVMK